MPSATTLPESVLPSQVIDVEVPVPDARVRIVAPVLFLTVRVQEMDAQNVVFIVVESLTESPLGLKGVGDTVKFSTSIWNVVECDARVLVPVTVTL